MKRPPVLALLACLTPGPETVRAQETPEPAAPPPALEDDPAAPRWNSSVSVWTYLPPEDDPYAQPTITADRGRLHLEARYNYEALETGSLWAGVHLSAGDRLAVEFTPMLGGVFGDVTGIAPGFHGTVSWWLLELYSEGEYVVDLDDTDASYFYSWSELSLSPLEWLRFGVVSQRTRVYESDRDIQRGLLAGVSFWKASLTVYVFNPDDTRPLVVVGLGAEF